MSNQAHAAVDAPSLLRSIEEGPKPPAVESLPRAVFPKPTLLDAGRLEDLAALIRKPIEVPGIGEAAAQAMNNCFETVARDVLAIAHDGVDRANHLLQEAETFAAIVRSNGEVLCDRIRSEAIRGLKISEVMRVARDVIGEAMPTDRVGADKL